jgi:ribosome-binding protein aMBF1 (putative translation factor)
MTRKKTTKKKAASKKKRATKKVAKKKVVRKKKRTKTVNEKPARTGAAVVNLKRFTALSISQLAQDTGLQRTTITARLADAGVQPADKFRGYPVYRLCDVLPALYQMSDGQIDPDQLKPFERRAYYQGELDKLKLQRDRGELVPDIEVEQELSRIFKIVTHGLETLPDILERDVGASPLLLARAEKHIDELRNNLYREIVSSESADSTAETGQ